MRRHGLGGAFGRRAVRLPAPADSTVRTKNPNPPVLAYQLPALAGNPGVKFLGAHRKTPGAHGPTPGADFGAIESVVLSEQPTMREKPPVLTEGRFLRNPPPSHPRALLKRFIARGRSGSSHTPEGASEVHTRVNTRRRSSSAALSAFLYTTCVDEAVMFFVQLQMCSMPLLASRRSSLPVTEGLISSICICC